MSKVKTGLDTLLEERAIRLHGSRIAVLANQATVDSNFTHLVDALHTIEGCKLVRIFAPEHGFRGELQDMAHVRDAADLRTGVPVTSLYGDNVASLKPKAEHLSEVDILLVDLPDIGTRYYTFAQALGYCLEVAASTRTQVIVLDRPNPIGGAEVEGYGLTVACRSYCGYAPVPTRHGLTLGELALLMNRGVDGKEVIDPIPAIGANLEIIKVEGWSRKDYLDSAGLSWVPPSPNMPTLDTALVYPGACLIEATSLSEGRGTTKPFEFLGAPGINAFAWAEAAAHGPLSMPGVALRPISFLPQFQKHAGSLCSGLQVHVTNRSLFKPFRVYLGLLFALREVQPQALTWRTGSYEFISAVPAIDLLYGSSRLREILSSSGSPAPILVELETYERAYLNWRKPFLLYD